MRRTKHILALFFLLSPVFACATETVRALESIPTSESVEAALEKYRNGEGLPADFSECFQIFKKAADSGDAVAQYQTGHMYLYANGTALDIDKAWHYFELAAAQGVDRAYGRMGYMLSNGIGFETDSQKAISLIRIAAQSDAQSMCNLARFIIDGKTPGTKHEAVQLLNTAVSLGNTDAFNCLGYYHTFHQIPNPDPELGVRLLKEAVKRENTYALQNLWNLQRRRPDLADQVNEALEGTPNSTYQLLRNQARRSVAEAVTVYQENGIEAGLKQLDDELAVWLRSQSIYSLRRQIWWEAQVLSGRDDPEWSYRLYRWLYAKCKEDYEERKPGKLFFDSAMLHNLSKEQMETGRIAEMRQTGIQILEGFRQKELIDLRLRPISALKTSQPKLPEKRELLTKVRRQMGNRHDEESVGKPLYYPDLFGIITLMRAKLYSGNWREMIGYGKWIEDWIDAVLLDGIDESVSRPNEVWQTQADHLSIEAEAFQWLGFYGKALENYRQIITANHKGYGFRHVHDARTKQAILEARTGVRTTESVEALKALQETRASNKFDAKRAPSEVTLAIASALRQKGDRESSKAKLDLLIEEADEERLFLIRTEALLTRILWALEDNELGEVEDDLIQLMHLSRSKGLKINEPELYHLYARYQASSGHLEEAIQLQLQAIEFYQSIDLYTWLPLRYIELAEWYYQTGNIELGDYYSELATQLINRPGSEYPAWILARVRAIHERLQSARADRRQSPTRPDIRVAEHKKDSNPSTADALPLLDLQPVQLAVVPLKSKPALGLYTLTNLSMIRQHARVIVTGPIRKMERTREGDFRIELDSESAISERSLEADLAANLSYLIYVSAPEGQAPLDATIRVDAGPTANQSASFAYASSDHISKTAVINANLIEGNPYYMIGILHIAQRTSDARDRAMDLRIRASMPARIEGYSENGDLLFVDADGDGTFHSPGDVLRIDPDASGYPNIEFSENSDTASFELMLAPHTMIEDGTLELQIETNSGEGWQLDAVDQIRYQP